MSTDMSRPVDTREVPAGYHLAAVPDSCWRLASGKHCAMRGKNPCYEQAVAELNRRRDGRISASGRPAHDAWYPYCPAHLYGRWVEDGKVMVWILEADTDG